MSNQGPSKGQSHYSVLTSGPMTISTQRGTGCGGPEVKIQKCMHKYYPDMYLILYCMTCFIVLYLIYVIYYACRFEKLLIVIKCTDFK
jgi:hypothetical protein